MQYDHKEKKVNYTLERKSEAMVEDDREHEEKQKRVKSKERLRVGGHRRLENFVLEKPEAEKRTAIAIKNNDDERHLAADQTADASSEESGEGSEEIRNGVKEK